MTRANPMESDHCRNNSKPSTIRWTGSFDIVPRARFRVVLRSGETVPIAVVELRIVAAIVITRPTRFLAGRACASSPIRRSGSGAGAPTPAGAGADRRRRCARNPLCSMSSSSRPRLSRLFAGHVEHAVAADVLVHDLFQPLQALKRIDVARCDGAGDDLVPAYAVGFERLDRPSSRSCLMCSSSTCGGSVL